MNKSVVELIVGVVFAAGILVLGAYTIVLSGVHLGSTKRFIVDFERVYGLKKGDAVRVEGYEKGEVKSLRLLSGGKIRAELEVQADVEIYKQNSDVRVTPFSPLGGRVVEIKRGIKDTPRGKYLSYGAAGDVGSPEEADVIVGTAEGEVAGNAFNWRYTVALEIDGRTWNVAFDDWMFLRPGGVIVNKAEVTKWGFKVGEATIFFRKDENAQAAIRAVAAE